MTILDTDLLSEIIRRVPDPQVLRWFTQQSVRTLHTTTISQAEMLYGSMILPEGSRRDALLKEIQLLFHEDFRGRVLPFESEAANFYGLIAASRRALGRPISGFDAQIAAIARSVGATVATRNVKDFEDCGVTLVDPWSL